MSVDKPAVPSGVPPWLDADALESRAAELVEYANSLPDGVSSEALSAAANMRSQAREIRKREPSGVPAEDAIREWCREVLSDGERCNAHAEFILWGKLLPPEALGPRCYNCAAKHVGDRALGDPAWAIFDLRKVVPVAERDRLAEAGGFAVARILRAEREAAEMREALEEIANVGTDLPHARRLDRDNMREIARAALASAATGGREGEADTDAREWDATLMRGLDATAARDPGCMRHTGDPHNLCPECWKAEAATGEAETT